MNTNAIFSDDPLAVPKLRARIEGLKKSQTAMRDFNKAWRKAGKPEVNDLDAWTQLAKDTGTPMGAITDLRRGMALDPLNRGPFPPYMLTNNGGNIKRLEKRLEGIEGAVQ